jgi:beta-mannosidase
MSVIDLCGVWKMRCLDGGDIIAATVPGSVYAGLLAAGKIEDPFFRENELESTRLSASDWEFSRNFTVDAAALAEERVELVCEGLDTLAEIFLNGSLVAKTSDMHRTYAFDARPFLRAGENTIAVIFRSPTKYMDARHAKQPLVGGSGGQYPGFNYLRKAHSMSGWDWGPVLPDAGIWRPISIRAESGAKLEDVYVTQRHRKVSGSSTDVTLSIRVRAPLAADGAAVAVSVEGPVAGDRHVASSRLVSGMRKIATGHDSPGHEYLETTLEVTVPAAKLWWPNNLGSQPLYRVTVDLSSAAGGEPADSWTRRIGLRTIGVVQKPDEWGESFALEANGVPFFAMGADYVPEDSLITRNTKARTERLVKTAAQANHNCIRVWGGANYPEDDFFDLCDEYGLIVWHDHMMACGVYELDAEFRENIVREIIDNVKRIRHHASLGLWCGNNEQEEAWVSWGWTERISPRLKADYIKLYEEIMPALNRELDPSTFYWLSSPSSGGSFAKPNAEGSGDMHNWQVWHGIKPFTAYRDCYSRFVSEFGIESFPPMRTIESFTLPEDRNIFSPVMESHQKCDSGNAKSLHYISETYRYPKDFSSLVYASELIQAEGIRYGVEHWRRNRNGLRCMGAVYWQLNDCWPVASWASVDYFGRWKALHYLSKRFFAPVLASACEKGTSVSLHVTNETHDAFKGTLIWRLCDDSRTVTGAAVLETGKHEVSVDPFTDREILSRDFAALLPDRNARRNAYLAFDLVADGKKVSSGSVLFVKSKHFNFSKEPLALSVEDLGTSFAVSVSAKSYARFVELGLEGADAIFSDNCFDLAAGDAHRVTVDKREIFTDSPAQGSVLEGLTAESFRSMLTVRSIADTY